jgi:hypothetical protein
VIYFLHPYFLLINKIKVQTCIYIAIEETFLAPTHCHCCCHHQDEGEAHASHNDDGGNDDYEQQQSCTGITEKEEDGLYPFRVHGVRSLE